MDTMKEVTALIEEIATNYCNGLLKLTAFLLLDFLLKKAEGSFTRVPSTIQNDLIQEIGNVMKLEVKLIELILCLYNLVKLQILQCTLECRS